MYLVSRICTHEHCRTEIKLIRNTPFDNSPSHENEWKELGHSNKRLSLIIMATERTNEKHFARDIIMTSLVGVRDGILTSLVGVRNGIMTSLVGMRNGIMTSFVSVKNGTMTFFVG